MSEQYKVKITPSAENAMNEIGRYIAVDLQSVQSAENTLNAISQEIIGLGFMPSRFALTPEEPWHSRSIRRMPVKNFFVYYRIDEASKIVYILFVVYARRNQKAQLAKLH